MISQYWRNAFKSKALTIFGFKRSTDGKWSKTHIEGLRCMSLGDKWGWRRVGHAARIGERRNVYKILVGKFDG